MQTGGGRSAFSVLLTQDIAVIPMLAFLPLLARCEPADDPLCPGRVNRAGGDGGG
jgi:CPA2 family monovalent cation:H+ antiporter-2